MNSEPSHNQRSLNQILLFFSLVSLILSAMINGKLQAGVGAFEQKSM